MYRIKKFDIRIDEKIDINVTRRDVESETSFLHRGRIVVVNVVVAATSTSLRLRRYNNVTMTMFIDVVVLTSASS